MITTIYSDPDFLEHHGVKGMKWGVRRYQNYDGTRIGASDSASKKYFNSSKNLNRSDPYYSRKDFKDAGLTNEEIKRINAERTTFRNKYHELDQAKDAYRYRKDITSMTKDEYIQDRVDNRKDAAKRFHERYTKSDEEYDRNWAAKNYDDAVKELAKLEKKYGDSLNSTSADKVAKEVKAELKETIKKLEFDSVEYGSDAWFEKREKYYDAVESSGSKYAEAVINDLKLDDLHDYTYSYAVEWIGSAAKGRNDDYSSIYDPVSGQRDYGLETKSAIWNAKQEGVLRSTPTPSQAKSIESDFDAMQKNWETNYKSKNYSSYEEMAKDRASEVKKIVEKHPEVFGKYSDAHAYYYEDVIGAVLDDSKK